ncbi:hypothetical protein Tco_0909287 [Tanacetum coccineum]|uniref:Uncharacterized protein n=1 Tax=Tanacetum coccineum TaxID=301880 RepID=A0ABQ5CSB9_9ASTR
MIAAPRVGATARLFPYMGWSSAIRKGFFKSEIENVGTKSRAAHCLPGSRISSRAAGRSSVESFYWNLSLRSLLELCLAVGLRSSSYLHYNLISGLGSLNNQISSTRDAFALDLDMGFFVLEITSLIPFFFSCFPVLGCNYTRKRVSA